MPVLRDYPAHLPFLAGAAAYPLAHFLLFKPLRLYVFGHELTHAFAAVVSGIRVKKFVAGKDSGHVVVERSNEFVALAPYFVPIYTVLTVAAWRLAAVWVPDARLRVPFLAATGATLAFHVTQTVETIAEGQKDLKQAGGTVFSLAVIALANAVVLALLFKLLFPASVSLRAFAEAVGGGTAGSWMWVWRYLRDLAS